MRYPPLSLTLWDSSVAACDKNDCTENGRSFWMTRLCRMLGSYYKPPFNYIKSWNFSNNYCNVRDLSKHQGTKALHHFAPKLIEALPGNGLFIPAPLYSGDCRVHFFVSFLCKQKRKEKKSYSGHEIFRDQSKHLICIALPGLITSPV